MRSECHGLKLIKEMESGKKWKEVDNDEGNEGESQRSGCLVGGKGK